MTRPRAPHFARRFSMPSTWSAVGSRARRSKGRKTAFAELMELAKKGIAELVAEQKKALGIE